MWQVLPVNIKFEFLLLIGLPCQDNGVQMCSALRLPFMFWQN